MTRYAARTAASIVSGSVRAAWIASSIEGGRVEVVAMVRAYRTKPHSHNYNRGNLPRGPESPPPNLPPKTFPLLGGSRDELSSSSRDVVVRRQLETPAQPARASRAARDVDDL